MGVRPKLMLTLSSEIVIWSVVSSPMADGRWA
jgi:hypothetical protein